MTAHSPHPTATQKHSRTIPRVPTDPIPLMPCPPYTTYPLIHTRASPSLIPDLVPETPNPISEKFCEAPQPIQQPCPELKTIAVLSYWHSGMPFLIPGLDFTPTLWPAHTPRQVACHLSVSRIPRQQFFFWPAATFFCLRMLSISGPRKSQEHDLHAHTQARPWVISA